MEELEKELLIKAKDIDSFFRSFLKPFRIDRVGTNGRKYWIKKHGKSFTVEMTIVKNTLALEFKNDDTKTRVLFDGKKYIASDDRNAFYNKYVERVKTTLHKFDSSII